MFAPLYFDLSHDILSLQKKEHPQLLAEETLSPRIVLTLKFFLDVESQGLQSRRIGQGHEDLEWRSINEDHETAKRLVKQNLLMMMAIRDKQ